MGGAVATRSAKNVRRGDKRGGSPPDFERILRPSRMFRERRLPPCSACRAAVEGKRWVSRPDRCLVPEEIMHSKSESHSVPTARLMSSAIALK